MKKMVCSLVDKIALFYRKKSKKVRVLLAVVLIYASYFVISEAIFLAQYIYAKNEMQITEFYEPFFGENIHYTIIEKEDGSQEFLNKRVALRQLWMDHPIMMFKIAFQGGFLPIGSINYKLFSVHGTQYVTENERDRKIAYKVGVFFLEIYDENR